VRFVLLIALSFACSRNGALVVNISSSELMIPNDTDQIVFRVFDGTTPLEERSYSLGTPPRNAWPLVQQINRGDASPSQVTVAVELRKEDVDGALLLVGYEGVDATLPASGFDSLEIVVERACDDADGDLYGVGGGCRGFDCNEAAIEQPKDQPCQRDGGVGDAGSSCGQVMCRPSEVCVGEDCLRRCDQRNPCIAPFACNEDLGACQCRQVTCRVDRECAPAGMCDHGCCVGL
jgi:hypothetical protein